MVETLAGFQFWRLTFNEEGQAVSPTVIDTFVNEVQAQNISDLFIFSHGWNNDQTVARSLYERFFTEVRKLVDDPNIPKRRTAKIGVAGVIWPSVWWPDNEFGDSGGGAASLGAGEAGSDFIGELKKVFTAKEQHRTLDELGEMLNRRERNEAALQEFKAKLNALIIAPDQGHATHDDLERQGILVGDDQWLDALDALADQEAPSESMGGAAGIGDKFGRLWDGAKATLRVASYWQMKNRAGIVGRNGLGPLIGRLHNALDLKIHLLGHSFGARLVSYALAGMPAPPPETLSPVRSLFLIQAAFSHFAFADALPFDKTRKGDLAGMAARVSGPLLTTHSLKDTAVGSAYPLASFLGGQDAADESDLSFRWGAMGHDGAQAVAAKTAFLSPAGATYPLVPGQWLNLDANSVIINGGPPSGAHSDIVHPHTAWAALAAAGIG
jgi:hypothetical protein